MEKSPIVEVVVVGHAVEKLRYEEVVAELPPEVVVQEPAVDKLPYGEVFVQAPAVAKLPYVEVAAELPYFEVVGKEPEVEKPPYVKVVVQEPAIEKLPYVKVVEQEPTVAKLPYVEVVASVPYVEVFVQEAEIKVPPFVEVVVSEPTDVKLPCVEVALEELPIVEVGGLGPAIVQLLYAVKLGQVPKILLQERLLQRPGVVFGSLEKPEVTPEGEVQPMVVEEPPKVAMPPLVASKRQAKRAKRAVLAKYSAAVAGNQVCLQKLHLLLVEQEMVAAAVESKAAEVKVLQGLMQALEAS